MKKIIIITLLVASFAVGAEKPKSLFSGWDLAVAYVRNPDKKISLVIIKDEKGYLKKDGELANLADFQDDIIFEQGKDCVIHLVHFSDGRQLTKTINVKSAEFLDLALSTEVPAFRK